MAHLGYSVYNGYDGIRRVGRVVSTPMVRDVGADAILHLYDMDDFCQGGRVWVAMKGTARYTSTTKEERME